MDPLRWGGEVRKGGVRAKKQRYYNKVPKLYLLWKTLHNKHFLQLTSGFLSLTCPEGGGLPMVVVVGEAGEAWHAARVVVLEPLEEFSQFLSALLLLLQPLSLLL